MSLDEFVFRHSKCFSPALTPVTAKGGLFCPSQLSTLLSPASLQYQKELNKLVTSGHSLILLQLVYSLWSRALEKGCSFFLFISVKRLTLSSINIQSLPVPCQAEIQSKQGIFYVFINRLIKGLEVPTCGVNKSTNAFPIAYGQNALRAVLTDAKASFPLHHENFKGHRNSGI